MEQDKEFKDFLKKIIEQNKVLIASDIVQTKTERDSLKLQIQEVKVEDQKIEKSLDQSKKLLEKIEKHLSASGEVYKKTNDKIISKLDYLSKIQDPKFQRVVRDDKDTRPLTMREILKGTVASAKSLGSNVGSSARNIFSGIKEAVTSPIKTLDKAHAAVSQKVGGIVEATKDVFSTEAGTMVGTIEGERFAKARKSSGIEYDDKSLQRGKQVYSAKKFKEQQIEDIREREAIQQTYGQTLSKKDQARLKTLQQEHGEVDLSPVTIDGKTISGKDQRKLLKNRRENEQRAGTFLQESPVQKEAEKAVEAKRQENPEADNIRSSQEVIADNSKEDLNLTKELLDTTKESVTILKDIRQSLADQIQPLRTKEQSVAPTQDTEVASGPGLGDLASSALDLGGDLLGRNKGKPGIPKPAGKPSLGGRIMGGIKSVGPGLLKGGAGAIGGMALGYGAEKLIESGHEKVGGALDVGAEALSGAGMGAMIGSVVPGIGTGIGAAIGGVAGGAYGLYKNFGNIFGSDKKQDGVQPSSTTREGLLIADQPFVPGQPLTQEQMAVIGMSKSMGNNYPPEVEAQYSKQLEGRAKGGPVEDGSDYIVGEKGPELFMPFKDGMVIPNDKSKKIIDGKIGLAEGGVAFANQIDTSLTSGLKSKQDAGYEISPWIGGVQRTKSSTGAQTIQGQVGGVDTTTEKDIYGNVRGRRSSTTLGDISTEMGYLQAGSTPAYAKVKGPDGQLVPGLGQDLLELSTENKDLERGSGSSGSSQPIVINNSSNNATTKVMPMKADPRPSSRGSALDRHIDRVSTY